MESLLELDRELLLAVNGWHSALADAVMLFFSGIENWIPLYILLALLMFLPKWYGHESYVRQVDSAVPMWIIGLTTLLALGLAFGLSDQISNLIKHSVCRLRPSQEPLLEGLVRTPEGRGGLYGFNSSHAANTMALAFFTAKVFCRKWYSISIVSWSLIICYSRIYLAKHYPGDILAGLLLGLLMGYVAYCLWVVALGRIRRKRDEISSR
ncbi:MAG: phosphatase PAP2 family protein [Alistipes sp.]|nr:phosphatase PAP2 family protein [Candidatus Minthomonas equi]